MIEVTLDAGMPESHAKGFFAFVALEDSCASDYIIKGKLEDDLLEHLPILGQVDMACHSSRHQADDFVVIDTLPWLVDLWHVSALLSLLAVSALGDHANVVARRSQRCPGERARQP